MSYCILRHMCASLAPLLGCDRGKNPLPTHHSQIPDRRMPQPRVKHGALCVEPCSNSPEPKVYLLLMVEVESSSVTPVTPTIHKAHKTAVACSLLMFSSVALGWSGGQGLGQEGDKGWSNLFTIPSMYLACGLELCLLPPKRRPSSCPEGRRGRQGYGAG